MNFLEKIRKRSWLVISVIGLSLLSFIINPKSIASFFSGDPNIIGKVNGQKITTKDYIQFQNLFESFQRNNPNKPPQAIINAQIWESLVDKKMIEEQILKAGIKISQKKEVEIYSQLLSMIGIENKNKLSKEQEDLINFQKDLMIGQTLASQYYEMIQKGINTTSLENILIKEEKETKAEINYVLLPYNEIKEKTKAEIKNQDPFPISKKEIEDYLKTHKNKYEIKEETRNLNLVVFTPQVSKEDEIKIEKQVNDLAKEFKTVKDHSIFASSNSDFPTYDNNRYLIEKNLPDYLKDFFKTAPIGAVYGPKKEGSAYLIIKLIDKKMISPATKASHILISYEGAQRSTQKRKKEEAKKIAYEYLEIIKKNPKEFENLVKKSDDPSHVQNKGNLGWINYQGGNFVKEFQNFVDNSPEGHLGIVETSLGYHVVSISKKSPNEKACRIELVIKNIKPSNKTEELLAKKVKDFVKDNKNVDLNVFVQNARKKGYNLILANDIKSSDAIIGKLRSPSDSEIIAWAFEKGSKEKEIKLFSSTNDASHIVAYVAKVTPKGFPSIDESLQAKIKPILEKEKIFNSFNKKVKNLKDLGQVKKSALDFHSSKIIEEGTDAQVVGTCLTLDPGKVYGPIKGEKGIYFVEILKKERQKSNAQDKPNKIYDENKYQFLIDKSIREKAVIEDHRKRKS